ncbi:MAG: hypothetical protein WCF03_05695, partial [Nitrososphaeraceae archaeon]
GFQSDTLPDLIVNVCPRGCNGKCARTWINDKIGHKIICICDKCHGKRALNKGRSQLSRKMYSVEDYKFKMMY